MTYSKIVKLNEIKHLHWGEMVLKKLLQPFKLFSQFTFSTMQGLWSYLKYKPCIKSVSMFISFNLSRIIRPEGSLPCSASNPVGTRKRQPKSWSWKNTFPFKLQIPDILKSWRFFSSSTFFKVTERNGAGQNSEFLYKRFEENFRKILSTVFLVKLDCKLNL